ncbi:hypothetical protein AVEN_236928-1 [Araneus ventricosus]|uniref:Uncharacterized protein n=1 Tax=Araneus ventricosus TaxID=182803 RepID=A0A4Y2UMY1_ARAVE|nr:hypothetical protein AVEN_236928-1 [Araneus ventricosus]
MVNIIAILINRSRVLKSKCNPKNVFSDSLWSKTRSIIKVSGLGFRAGGFQVRNPTPLKIYSYVGLAHAKPDLGQKSSCRCGAKVWRWAQFRYRPRYVAKVKD